MSVTWTEEQKQVIETRNTNLLVSAAAGSGKTAVLVERILSLITDPEHPVDVDRLLITTFTKAAAGEMKERIGKALNDRLKEDPGNEWLQRQESLVHRAQITTIHGFCLYVIRNYFHSIDLNPNFRIADEGEMKLLKQDTAKEILEEAYEKKDPAFLKFADSYGSGNRGSGLEDMILGLYEYAVASPQPVRWLTHCADVYDMPEEGSWQDFAGQEEILKELKLTAGDALAEIRKARALCRLPGGPGPYEEVLLADETMIQELTDCQDVGLFREKWEQLSYGRLPSRRAKVMADADEELCDRIMAMRNEVKDLLKGLGKQYFQISDEEQFRQLRETRENVAAYADLTLAFLNRLNEKKRKKNILDFADQEHLALQILTREEDGKLVPSETADIFADYFEEIMVDEYQDSNLVQEAILNSISKSRKGRDNRFMVGDVKQSIYRFRQAEPGLFLGKYAAYGEENGGVRIDLHRNFRSRGEVLSPVNEIFERIMRPELGGILYDEDAALKEGAVYPETDGNGAEILLLQKEDWESFRKECRWSRAEAEAHLIASRIRKLLQSGTVTDHGTLRPAELGDMVILLRTMSGWSETFVRVLQEEGIPASAQSREGYFQTMEVETLLAYLRVLDNPTQEIPLAATLHGLLGGFSSADLAEIKAASPEKSFLKACQQYRTEGADEKRRDALNGFFRQVEHYRELASYTSVHELLWMILTETGYLDQIRALPGGVQRLANVEMLLAKAQDYEKISYHGLFHFVRYIERMQKYQMDFGEADISGSGKAAVQIMSIHHSKGLEFPIVFVAGMGKSFNRQESRDKMVFHNRWGVGIDYVDLENRMKRPALIKQLIRRQNLLSGLGEELRVLYVAMTRAREKLILTGMIDGKTDVEAQTGEPLLFSRLLGAKCSMEWILPARNPESEQSGFTVESVSMEELLKESVVQQMTESVSRDDLERMLVYGSADPELSGEVEKRLSWDYAWKDRTAAKQKYSVTELKKLRLSSEEDPAEELYPETEMVPILPRFIEQTEEKTGAARGTVYHTVMQWMDFARIQKVEDPAEAVRQELDRLTAAGKLTEEDRSCIRPADFVRLVKSGLIRRLAEAEARQELYREQPFVIGLPGDQVDGSDPEETVLIQGIIDAFFYEEDEIVVVDYKTDHIRHPEELVERYRQQLQYYEQALAMVTGKPVKERLIYSFALGKLISV